MARRGCVMVPDQNWPRIVVVIFWTPALHQQNPLISNWAFPLEARNAAGFRSFLEVKEVPF